MVYCRQCEYWIQSQAMPEWGECRHCSPQPYTDQKGTEHNIGPYNFRAIWPFTRSIDFCGAGSTGKRFAPAVNDQTVTPTRTSFDTKVKEAMKR